MHRLFKETMFSESRMRLTINYM